VRHQTRPTARSVACHLVGVRSRLDAAGLILAGAIAVSVVLTAAAATACGPSAARPASASDCSAPLNERLDPQSVRHLFPGAAEPRYLTDPPTSGPHQLGPPVQGTATTPISRPKQVAMLESGYVILQYRNISPAQLSTLSGLAGNLVTVAPAAGPLPGPVVATAWTWKLACGSVSPAAVAAMGAFVAAHRGVGFAGGGG
jgi:hypothetical protein